MVPAPPAESGDFRRPQALLAPRVASGASAEAVALAWLLLWQAVERALIPIVGVRGVAALFNRSLRLAAEAGHPWLDPRRAEPGSRVDAPALQARLAQRGSAEALAGGDALLKSFDSLLASLVGESLTERLLGAVWSQPTRRQAAQDNPP